MEVALIELERLSHSAELTLHNTSWKKLSELHSQEDSPAFGSFTIDQNRNAPDQGDTTLHRILASHAPLDIVRLYMKQMQNKRCMASDPKRAKTADSLQCQHNGISPLHAAVYRNSFHAPQIVDLLLEHNPELASMPMSCGTYPLQIVCGLNKTINKDVFQRLLQSAPDVVLQEDHSHDNALSLLWKNVMRFRWAALAQQGQPVDDFQSDNLSWMGIITPQQFIDFSVDLVRASKGSHQTKNITIHDLCAFPRCPPLLIRLALAKQSAVDGDLFTMDANGMLPIHHAARSAAVTHKFVPDHHAGTQGMLPLVEFLLENYKESVAVFDGFGRLPLHHALASNDTHARTILALVSAFPESLRIRDPVTGLYPFMLVASNQTGFITDSSSIAQHNVPRIGTFADMLQSKQASGNEQRDKHTNLVNMTYLFLSQCPDPLIPMTRRGDGLVSR